MNNEFEDNERKFRGFCYLGFGMAFFVGFILLIAVPSIPVVAGETFNVGGFVLGLTTIYLILSWRLWDSVKEDEVAALFAFGVPIKNLESGPPFAPPGLTTVRRVTRSVQQREFPAEPELIHRGPEKSVPEHLKKLGYKPPIRVAFTKKITPEAAKAAFEDELVVESLRHSESDPVQKIPFATEVPDDGLAERVTAEPNYIIRFRVDDAINFFRNIGSIEETFRQLEDESTNIMVSYFSKMSLAQALVNQRWMSIILHRRAHNRVQGRYDPVHGRAATKDWGIIVESVSVKFIHLDHGLNTSISVAAQAPFDAAAKIKDAEATKQKLILEGEGAAEAARLLEEQTLLGRSAGISKMAEQTGLSSTEIQSAEVAREVARGGNTVVVGSGGMAELAGLAAAAAAISKPKAKNDADGENSPDAPDSQPEKEQ